MTTGKYFTTENTYYFPAAILPPQNEEKVNEHIERIRADARGRTAIQVCCKHTAQYLNGALEFGLTWEQKTIFENFFDHHKDITQFETYRVKESRKDEFKIEELIRETFAAVAKIGDPPELQNYFLDCVWTDVLYLNNSPYYGEARSEFERTFTKRRKRFMSLPEQLRALALTDEEEKAIVVLWGASDPSAVGIVRGDPYREWLMDRLKYYSQDIKRAFVEAAIADAITDDNNYFEIIQALRMELKEMPDGVIYGEQLVEIVLQALEELGMLDKGRYSGPNTFDKNAIVKALFKGLWDAGKFGKDSPNRAAVKFHEITKKIGGPLKPDTFYKAAANEPTSKRWKGAKSKVTEVLTDILKRPKK